MYTRQAVIMADGPATQQTHKGQPITRKARHAVLSDVSTVMQKRQGITQV